MGRRKKTDVDPPVGGETPKAGHNQLTEDQMRALFFQHKDNYEVALSDKKTADARLKNVCKTARAELGKTAVLDIKDAIALEEPEGEAAHRADIERKIRIAKWMNSPIGTQFTFAEDMTPSIDRAFDEGKRIGLAGAPCNPPHDPSVPQYARWMEGFHEGQAVLANGGFKKPAEAQPSA